MEKKYKIVYYKKDCIGAGACEYAAPELWEYIIDESIATLKDPNTEKTPEKEVLIIGQDTFERHLEAAEACPVHIIEIYDLETGEKIHPK